ncbi:MAG: hypothetical protein L3J13_09125 [Devosiaceae bacterium]|nr:hypothetical protein [Devosiaceae bacterium]
MNKSNIQELIDAGHGTVALLMGRRNAGEYFDLGLRGLAGSFIAFLVAATFNAFLPSIMGRQTEVEHAAMLTPTSAILMVITLFAIQTAFGALALRQFGRLDGLVPYLVADNWATFYITALSVVLMLLNVSPEMSILMVGVVVLISEINIARLIVTLKPMQIAMFLIAQLVGILVGLMIVGSFLPEGALGQ